MSTTTITLPYTDKTTLTLTFDERNLGEVIRPASVAPIADSNAAIARALDAPLGLPPLAECVRPGQRVLILSDDNTRSTPTARILPVVLERLRRAGVRAQDIEILIAAGTHRPMTDAEITLKLGVDVAAQYRVTRHECHNPAALYHAGVSREGIPVWLNRRVREAEFVIGIGNVVPHPHVGWSGGAKILCPGVAGAETVAAFHRVGIEDPTNHLGRDDAPARQSLEALADAAGLHFVINTVLTSNHRLHRIFAGQPRQAQIAARQASREVYGVPVRQRYDIVIANAYPAFLEFWQAGKGIFSADLILKPGGSIILIAPCPEGIGVTHPKQTEYLGLALNELQRQLLAGDMEDPIAAAVCVKVKHIQQRARVAIVSDGLREGEARALGCEPLARVEDALDALLSQHGRQSKVAVITHGGETIPYVV